jgi:HK97 family phage portal protein
VRRSQAVARASQHVRASWTRTGDRDWSVNSPDGFLADPSFQILQPSGGSPNPGFFWTGSDQLGDLVGRGGAERLAAVTRATGLICGPVSRLPLRVYTGPEFEPVGLDTPVWLRDPQLVGRVQGRSEDAGDVVPVGRRQSGSRFWFALLRDALWWGAGFLLFAEDDRGQPRLGSLRHVNPGMVSVDDSGRFVVGDGSDTVTTDTTGRTVVGGVSWRLMRLEGPGVLTNHPDVFNMALAVQSYTSSSFASGVPAGYLKVSTPNLTADQADALRVKWLATHGNRRTIAILNSTVDFTPVAVKPVDMDLVNISGASLRDIAHAFNMSAVMLDAQSGGSMDYANINDRRQDFVDHTLTDLGTGFGELVTAVLPAGTWAQVDYRGYLETNQAEKISYYTAMVGLGAMTVDEVRRLERLPPLEQPVDVDPDPVEEEVGDE